MQLDVVLFGLSPDYVGESRQQERERGEEPEERAAFAARAAFGSSRMVAARLNAVPSSCSVTAQVMQGKGGGSFSKRRFRLRSELQMYTC